MPEPEDVEEDPLSVVDRGLNIIIARQRARGAAVLLIRGDDLEPCLSRGIGLTRFELAHKMWKSRRALLRAGSVIVREDHMIVPVRHDGDVIALVMVDEPRRDRSTEIDQVVARIADALVVPDGELLPVLAVDHAKLLRDTLDQFGWNIAKVARVLDVTRRTVYLRMLRYGIQRQKMPRVQKP